MFVITSKYFSIFNNRSSPSWVQLNVIPVRITISWWNLDQTKKKNTVSASLLWKWRLYYKHFDFCNKESFLERKEGIGSHQGELKNGGSSFSGLDPPHNWKKIQMKRSNAWIINHKIKLLFLFKSFW